MASRAFNFVRGKKVFAAAIIASLGLFASPAWATCTGTATLTCSDTTQIKAYQGNSFASTYSGNGFTNGVGDVLQTTSYAFNTDKLIATLTQSRQYTTLELKYYTSFNGNELGAHYADIFLGAGNTNNFGYAIALGNESGNGGVTTAGFYDVTSATEKTSKQIWSTKSGTTYGGQFAFQATSNSSTTWADSPTVVAANAAKYSGTSAAQTTVVETNQGAGATDPGYPYLVDVKLTLSNTDFNALFGGGLSVFWGTADCSNDAILAYIPITALQRVPEPVTLSLFSAGLVGAAAMRRRRRKSETA